MRLYEISAVHHGEGMVLLYGILHHGVRIKIGDTEVDLMTGMVLLYGADPLGEVSYGFGPNFLGLSKEEARTLAQVDWIWIASEGNARARRASRPFTTWAKQHLDGQPVASTGGGFMERPGTYYVRIRGGPVLRVCPAVS
jgi:hypothetical protein